MDTRRFFVPAALALSFSPALAAHDLRSEIAALTDVPYTTAVAGAAQSETTAWVTQRAGTLHVYVAAAPSFQPHELVSLTGDVGDTIESPTLSADGRWLAYVRGPDGRPNGRIPNPAGLVAGLERALWLISTRGGAPIRIAAGGEAPVFSPDGSKLAFELDGVAALVELPSAGQAGAPGPVTRPFRDMGHVHDLRWSPQSDALAFVSSRTAHSVTGIYRLGADRVQWMAPGIGIDGSLAWSADGKRLALLRRPGIAYSDVQDVMRNSPFSLWVVDTGSGEGRAIYRSPGNDGGLQTEFDLRWLADGRILFLSDADGYSHLYAVSPGDGQVTQLSHGACDLESFAVDAPGTTIVVSGNCFDRYRRDVAVWKAGEPGFARVSSAGSVATDAVFVGTGTTLVYRSATYNRAQAPVLLQPQAAERLLQGPPTTVAALQQPEIVQFKAPDGTALTGVLFRAVGAPRGAKTPGVVFAHGGPIRQMLPAWYMTPYYAYAYAANQQLALHGITVLAVNYRTGVGFGRAFREVKDYGPHGAGELQDVIAAGDFLRAQPTVDGTRVGIYGGSFGGHLAANALGRRSDLFKAGVVWHGVYDFTRSIDNRDHPDRLAIPWGASESGRALALSSSAIAHVATWRSPTLLVGGDDDRHAEFQEAVNLARALEAAGHPPETLVLPNEIHGFLRHTSWLTVIAAGNAFLIDHLAGPEATTAATRR